MSKGRLPTAEKMASTRTESAIVAAFTPICVNNGKAANPTQIAELKAKAYYQRGDFVEKAGWVRAVSEEYRHEVADACAPKVVEAAEAAAKSG